jgi:hypothetical protein
MNKTSINTNLPRIVAYWTGYEKLDFNPSQPSIPTFVKDINVLILAFSLVRNGTIQYTCAPNETCLCNGEQYWTQSQIKQWLGAIKTSYPEIKILLSIGGWAFNDWKSVTNATTFVSKVVDKFDDWSDMIDGLDIDYESGADSTTSLPDNISFHSVVKALIDEMVSRLSGNPILSLPYYSGSPWRPNDLADLKDSISFVSTMGYGQDTSDYQELLEAGYRAVNGISDGMTLSDVVPFIKNNEIKAAMFWNLCEAPNDPPSAFIKALNDCLPGT